MRAPHAGIHADANRGIDIPLRGRAVSSSLFLAGPENRSRDRRRLGFGGVTLRPIPAAKR